MSSLRVIAGVHPVSYTHLDVYKRQVLVVVVVVVVVITIYELN